MAIFKINAVNPTTDEKTVILYDSSASKLMWEDGTLVIPDAKTSEPSEQVKLESGKKDLSVVKIQLGLSCNFECDYCSQRFVPHADSTNPNDVQPFVDNMSSWFDGGTDGLGAGTKFEYWGGEPFVYWKTMKPLAEAIAKKYPNTEHLVITNGSLLDKEKIDWLEEYKFTISISHDGPGQHVRGPDPLDDPKSKEAIIEMFRRLAPKGKTSFNSMINSKNISREDISKFFENFVRDNIGEEYLQYLHIGEGGFVDAYDEGGLNNSLLDSEEDIKYRNFAYMEIRDAKTSRFLSINQKVESFINGIVSGRRIESLAQKCGMDKSSNIALDLKGNVLTCQNVSAISNNPAGVSHHIGHINDLESIDVSATSTHWSDRDECPKCPVVHLCKGACMFLSGELWEASCNNAFSDNIIIFANAIEYLTGYIPIYIDGPQREDRKDIFWWVNGKPENTRKAKKVIPIVAV
jgi:uncharacterized protein